MDQDRGAIPGKAKRFRCLLLMFLILVLGCSPRTRTTSPLATRETTPDAQQDTGSGDETAVFLRQPWFQWPTEQGAYLMAITTNEVPLDVVVEYEGGRGTFRSVPTPPDVFAPRLVVPAEVYFHEVELQWPAGTAQVDVSITNGGSFRATLDVPQQEAPLNMIVFGDTRGGDPAEDSGLQGENSAHEMVIDRMVTYDPAVVIHTGDMVPYGEKLSHWANFLSIEEELLSTSFLFPVVGNHDLTADGDAANFDVLFHTENTYLSEGSYWADLGLVGLVALDQYTLSDFTPQHQQWVEDALQHLSDKKWLIFACHEPLRSAVARDNWADTPLVSILEENGVDLVVSGHDHIYEHFYDNGIHYFISGGGGAPLSDLDESKLSGEGVMAAGAFYHFIQLTISDTSIEGTVINASNGSVFKTFTIDSASAD